jgi:phosphonate metabolism protein (transferase hexapeptide repeat family)
MTFVKEFNSNHTRTLSVEPSISETAKVKDSYLGKYTEIMDWTSFTESSMDDYSYICGYGSVIYTEIGKFSNIASQVRINPGNHPIERPTLHHFTYRGRQFGFTDYDDSAFFSWRKRHKVKIGHDTWIGHGVVIMPGVSIGNGAIVGSSSVVTKDVPPYAIVAGVPAKPVRYRFHKYICEALQEIAWWDWDHETIKSRYEDFKDLRTFIEKYSIKK